MIGKVWKRIAAAFLTVAVVFSTVGGALERTFRWDNVAQCSVSGETGCWPAGTTVELCSNGLCIPGLDGATMPTAHYLMDIPVEYGGVIDAKARAVAPAGYQCGDPPVPCPYSDWSNNVILTYPPPPSGFTYSLEERNEMADPTFGELGMLSYSSGSYINSQSTTIQNVAVGDLLLVVVQRNIQNSCTGVASTSPALTFTKLATALGGNDFNEELWGAIATSSASSQVITASYSDSEPWGSIFSARYSGGVSSITPNATTAHTTRQSSSTNRTNANMTTTARTLMIAFGTNWDYYYLISAAANWNLRVNSDTFGNDTTTQFLLDRVANAGTYPSGNYGTNATADQYMSGIVALPVSAAAASLPPHLTNPSRSFAHLLPR